MMRTIKGIIGLFQIPIAILHIFLMKTSTVKETIDKDIERWMRETGLSMHSKIPKWRCLVLLLWRCPAFRNLFYYRIATEDRIISRALSEFAKFFYNPLDTLFIYTPDIGPALYIQHGFSTIISAKRIGQNCWINQQVTIGYTNFTDAPTIGDNVSIMAGAKVFGDIIIGNNSIVGANAVVVKDIPPNCTVVGVPAYIVKRDGKKVRKEL